MPKQNRVAPTGEVVAADQRGALMGNRGPLTRRGAVVRPWAVRRWIACALEHRDWRAPAFGTDGRYTALFFLDEAVALAAGHRPCALCRQADHERWRRAWEAAVGPWRGVDGVDGVDARLHADRLDGRRQRRHRRPWRDLPPATYVLLDDRPAVVEADLVRPWLPGPGGYASPVERPTRGEAVVLTPACTVDVLAAGYRLAHPPL